MRGAAMRSGPARRECPMKPEGTRIARPVRAHAESTPKPDRDRLAFSVAAGKEQARYMYRRAIKGGF
jgi:hypothetical protein